MRVWGILLALALAGTAAQAQTPTFTVVLEPLGERPEELSAQRPYLDTLREGLQGTLASFTNAQSCSRAVVRSVAFADVSSVDVATQRATQNGGRLFNERLHAEMCGVQYMPNYYALIIPGQAVRLLEGVPGQTRASPQLQADVQPRVLRVARALAECPEPNVIGIAHTVVGQSAEESDGSWQETWIVSACRARVDVPLRFQPSAGGGIDFGVNGEGARVTR